MKKLGPTGFPVDSYVTGIYDKLESNGTLMTLVWHTENNNELYYMRCDFTSVSATAIWLYSDILKIYETVFVGTTVRTIAGFDYIKQAYSVGYTRDIKKDNNILIDIADNLE